VIQPTDIIAVSDQLRSLLIEDLNLSRRSINALKSARFQRAGDLDGLSVSALYAVRNLGRKSIDEIVCCLGSARAQTSGGNETPHIDSGCEPLRIAGTIGDWPLTSLELRRKTVDALHRAGFESVGSLANSSARAIASLSPADHERPAELQAAIDRIVNFAELAMLARVDARTERPLPTNLPLDLLKHVAVAKTVEEEHRALLYGLSDRNATFLWKRWQKPEGRTEFHLEDLGDTAGISRERVRQIVASRESILTKSNLRLPLSTRAVSVLEDLGGAATGQQWVSESRRRGLPLFKADLDRLEAISDLGLVDLRPRFDFSTKLWFTPRGYDHWVVGGRLAQLRRKARRLRRSIQEFGAIPISKLRSCRPLGSAFTLRLVAPTAKSFYRLGDFLVMDPPPATTLVKIARKALAVTQPMPISDLYSGITRWWPYQNMRRKSRVVELPAEGFVRCLLSKLPGFVVENDTIRLAENVDLGDVLRPSEQLALKVFEANHGIVVWHRYLEAMEEMGIPMATASLTLRAPFVVRRGSSLYALRSRNIPRSIASERRKERDQLQESSTGPQRWLSADMYQITYRVTRFSSQGVFPAPSGLRALKTTHWTGRFPDGCSEDVILRKGFLYKLGPWLTRIGASIGDEFIATFFVAEGIIEFDLLSSEER
jgi:hypothetical protein